MAKLSTATRIVLTERVEANAKDGVQHLINLLRILPEGASVVDWELTEDSVIFTFESKSEINNATQQA